MKIKLNSTTDTGALAVIARVQKVRSVSALIGAYADLNADNDDDDFQVEVHKTLLADSYRSNPCLFAGKVRAAAGLTWLDSSGYQTPNRPDYITVILHRCKKAATARRTQGTPSVNRVIKDWLDLNLPSHKKLKLPIPTIPPFLSGHPEQLTYKIKVETGTPIKITRLTHNWLISRA